MLCDANFESKCGMPTPVESLDPILILIQSNLMIF